MAMIKVVTLPSVGISEYLHVFSTEMCSMLDKEYFLAGYIFVLLSAWLYEVEKICYCRTVERKVGVGVLV
jgi:hypothetical protein